MIDGKTFFNQPVKNNLRTYDNIQEIANGPGDDYTTGCLLGCLYFKNYYKMIAVDLSKQKSLMLIQKQYNRLILLEISIEQETQFFSLLKKQKKQI